MLIRSSGEGVDSADDGVQRWVGVVCRHSGQKGVKRGEKGLLFKGTTLSVGFGLLDAEDTAASSRAHNLLIFAMDATMMRTYG